nr:unnamed protein product [Haemonchus contortus]
MLNLGELYSDLNDCRSWTGLSREEEAVIVRVPSFPLSLNVAISDRTPTPEKSCVARRIGSHLNRKQRLTKQNKSKTKENVDGFLTSTLPRDYQFQ